MSNEIVPILPIQPNPQAIKGDISTCGLVTQELTTHQGIFMHTETKIVYNQCTGQTQSYVMQMGGFLPTTLLLVVSLVCLLAPTGVAFAAKTGIITSTTV